MNTEHATPELFAALAKAQAEVENATKGSVNPHFKSKYADLAEVYNTVRPTFAKHGLGLLQGPTFDGAMVSVETIITHSSGGFVSSVASCVPAKTDAQGIGAATTYLRRYGLAAMTGVAQEDDDGQSASHNREPNPVAVKSSAQAKRDGDWEAFKTEIDACLTLDELNLLVVSPAFVSSAKALPNQWKQQLRDYIEQARAEFDKANAPRAAVAPDFTKLENVQ